MCGYRESPHTNRLNYSVIVRTGTQNIHSSRLGSNRTAPLRDSSGMEVASSYRTKHAADSDPLSWPTRTTLRVFVQLEFCIEMATSIPLAHSIYLPIHEHWVSLWTLIKLFIRRLALNSDETHFVSDSLFCMSVALRSCLVDVTIIWPESCLYFKWVCL